jgi:hypothetical protein
LRRPHFPVDSTAPGRNGSTHPPAPAGRNANEAGFPASRPGQETARWPHADRLEPVRT